MKKLTKTSAILVLCVVLSLPMIVSAKVTELGVYWPSTISLTRSNIYARAESRGNIWAVESKAVFTMNQGLPPLAFDSGVYWSEINTARPEGRYGLVGNFAYYSGGIKYSYDSDVSNW